MIIRNPFISVCMGEYDIQISEKYDFHICKKKVCQKELFFLDTAIILYYFTPLLKLIVLIIDY